ncbi:uncharacterized protein [Vulpes vulpes]|uniref:Ral guanine nucleotide dissociation stimulator-like n=1 Tax=Vulpes vulpes TaxID=9627 RepID=A0ABM5AVG1_VULVU
MCRENPTAHSEERRLKPKVAKQQRAPRAPPPGAPPRPGPRGARSGLQRPERKEARGAEAHQSGGDPSGRALGKPRPGAGPTGAAPRWGRALTRTRPEAERASALRRNRICPTTPSRRELLEQEVEELVPALLRLDNLSLFEFLNVVEEYGTPEEVLDLLFANAMTSFLTIWLDYYEEDFHDAPEFPALTKLLKFTGQYQCQAQCSTVVRSVTFGVS